MRDVGLHHGGKDGRGDCKACSFDKRGIVSGGSKVQNQIVSHDEEVH